MQQMVERPDPERESAKRESAKRESAKRESAKRESVWDYPRPPRVEASNRLVRVEFAGRVIAESTRTLRVLETSHPPVFYIPGSDVEVGLLRVSAHVTFCEFKGETSYFDLVVGDSESLEAAWEFAEPNVRYESLQDHLAFYPGRVDACYVDGERVRPQEGGFYGGWITSEIIGPFKGAPGTRDW